MAKSVKKSVPALAAKAAKSTKSVAIAPTVPVVPDTVKPVARASIPLTARIVVVATSNPKRPGTIAASKFPIYFALRDAAKGKAFAVADLVAAFAKKGYPARRAFSALRFDGERSYIEVRDEAGKLLVTPRSKASRALDAAPSL